MKKFKLLLLDANVVIELFAFQLWEQYIKLAEKRIGDAAEQYATPLFDGATDACT